MTRRPNHHRAAPLRLSLTLLASFALAGCPDGRPDPAPTVAQAAPIRGEAQLSREGFDESLSRPMRVEEGATLTTSEGAKATLRLDGGAWLLLDESAQVELALDRVTLRRGRVWVDARGTAETTIVTSKGTLRASEGSFAVALGETVDVYCASGELAYQSESGEGRVAQGEELRLGEGDPDVGPADVWDDWTGGLADPMPSDLGDAHHVGVLSGRQQQQLGLAPASLSIRSHEARATISGDRARTETTQTFFNGRSEALDAEYVIRIPEAAIIEEFAVDTGSGFAVATVTSMGEPGAYALQWRARAIQESRLIYEGPGRYRARIHPVAGGSVVRIRVVYTEWLERRGSMRSYVYPMEAGAEPPLIGEFFLEVNTAGTEVGALRAGMGATVTGANVTLRRSDFRPRADFTLDLIDPEGEDATLEIVATVQSGGEGESEDFVLLDVPTEGWVEAEELAADPGLDLMIAVDVSRGIAAEDLELSRAVVESVLHQLGPDDRVSLRLVDVAARAPEGLADAPAAVTEEHRDAILGALSEVHRGGATDLGESLRQAALPVVGKKRGVVLYLGDGAPSTGALGVSGIRDVLSTLDAPPRFVALGVGHGARQEFLRSLFGPDTHVIHGRSEAARVVSEILALAGRPTLNQVSVDLGASVERAYPTSPLSVEVGRPVRIVARMRDGLPEEAIVRASFGGQVLERALPIRSATAGEDGDIARRWATHRLEALLDQNAGREALIELGHRFGLVTPFTSLQVGTVSHWFMPVRGFDHDPYDIAWALGGRGVDIGHGDAGGSWRSRVPGRRAATAQAPESTFVSRVGAPSARAPGDGGLARAGVLRALARGERGPRGCYERRLLTRADLEGTVDVEVEVAPSGEVTQVHLVSSTLGLDDVNACVLGEVRGIRFPAIGGPRSIKVTHTFVFSSPGRQISIRRHCSEASRMSLSVRKRLWTERLELGGNSAATAMRVWHQALGWCELSDFRARRALMERMLEHVSELGEQLNVYAALSRDPIAEVYLRRAILRRVRTPEEVILARHGLHLNAEVEWPVFSRLWHQQGDAAARLTLVRRWRSVVPEDIDLRLRLLSLLEETGAMPEARRVARELRDDPLADATVRARVGEMWLRQGDADEGRRVFSEIIEEAPLDPWARRRLGDLYLAHHFYDEAYREYQTLARLRPDAPDLLLLLSRAAAGAGRVDEALRLEQRLSEEDSADGDMGPAALARLSAAVRLAHLKQAAEDDSQRLALSRRERETGALRNPPALWAALIWEHPEDALSLSSRVPGADADDWEAAPLAGPAYGIAGLRVIERREGEYRLRVERGERDSLRESEAILTVVIAPGTEGERVLQRPLHLTRESPRSEWVLDGDELREVDGAS